MGPGVLVVVRALSSWFDRKLMAGEFEEARTRQHFVEETDRKWYSRSSPWFDQTIVGLGRQTIEARVNGGKGLRRYRFFFKRFFDLAGHPFPEGQDELTGPALNALYLTVVADFYGSTLTLEDWDGYTWQQTPHFFTSPLYMGKYGLSSAAANAMISQLTSTNGSEAATARSTLLELMRSGASDYPVELLARAGADLGDPLTTEALVTRLDSLVTELERAVGGG